MFVVCDIRIADVDSTYTIDEDTVDESACYKSRFSLHIAYLGYGLW